MAHDGSIGFRIRLSYNEVSDSDESTADVNTNDNTVVTPGSGVPIPDVPAEPSQPSASTLTQTTSVKPAESSDSETEDESLEKCAICLRSIKNQEVGTPEGCDHCFCLHCLVQWAKNSNKCPMDRRGFSLILAKKSKTGEVLRTIPVKGDDYWGYDDDEITYCEVCGRSDDEASMILCDGCDHGYHLDCLTPAINAIPEDDWFCPECVIQGDPLHPFPENTAVHRYTLRRRPRNATRVDLSGTGLSASSSIAASIRNEYNMARRGGARYMLPRILEELLGGYPTDDDSTSTMVVTENSDSRGRERRTSNRTDSEEADTSDSDTSEPECEEFASNISSDGCNTSGGGGSDSEPYERPALNGDYPERAIIEHLYRFGSAAFTNRLNAPSTSSGTGTTLRTGKRVRFSLDTAVDEPSTSGTSSTNPSGRRTRANSTSNRSNNQSLLEPCTSSASGSRPPTKRARLSANPRPSTSTTVRPSTSTSTTVSRSVARNKKTTKDKKKTRTATVGKTTRRKKKKTTVRKKKRTVRKKKGSRAVTIRKKTALKRTTKSVTFSEVGSDIEEEEETEEEVIETKRKRTVRKRRKKRRLKRKKVSKRTTRSSGTATATATETVRGRLAKTLGMVPPKRPGQLLPDVKTRAARSSTRVSRIISSAPTLHIFQPRNELEIYPSGSEDEGFGDMSGSTTVVSTMGRSNMSHQAARRKAALMIHSSSVSSRIRTPVVEVQPLPPPNLLDTILECQSVWHSQGTDIVVNPDGTIIANRKNKSTNNPSNEVGKSVKETTNIDVRQIAPVSATKETPMYPGTGPRSSSTRTFGGRHNTAAENQNRPREFGIGGSGRNTGSSRYGGSVGTGREGYTNYLNNAPPQGPAPYCRGGPPLRFRMQSRPLVRRNPLPPRLHRAPWQQEEEEEEEEAEEPVTIERVTPPRRTDEEVDIYSDIEGEESTVSFPALGPPPEPPAFLLGLGDEDSPPTDDKNMSDVYDPAEPCDSEEEMVIDEANVTQTSTIIAEPDSPQVAVPPTADEDHLTPIEGIYSSSTLEFSKKGESDREKELSEVTKKTTALLQEEANAPNSDPLAVDIESKDEVTEQEQGSPTAEEDRSKLIEQDDDDTENNIENKKKNKKPSDVVRSRLSFDLYEDKISSSEERETSPVSPTLRKSRSRSPLCNPTKSSSPEICAVAAEGAFEQTERDSHRSSSSESKSDRSRSPIVQNERCSPRQSVSRSVSPTINIENKMEPSSSERVDKPATTFEDSSDNFSDEMELHARDKGLSEDEEKGQENGAEQVVEQNKSKDDDSDNESLVPKVAPGLEGLDVEEVSSENDDGNEFSDDNNSLGSLSLSDLSKNNKQSSPGSKKKKKKSKRKRKATKGYEEGEIDSEKERRRDSEENAKSVGDHQGDEENKMGQRGKSGSRSVSPGRSVLTSRENKKTAKGDGDIDLSWKKPSKKDKNYREGKIRTKEQGRTKSGDKRKSRSRSRDKKKTKEKKKKLEKKKDIERYDVRKVVKNKEVRKTDAFGRDIISKSRSKSKSQSRSRSPFRNRSRNRLRRPSRSFSRSASRNRRARSPNRRKFRTRSRSRSISKSPSRSPRKLKKKTKSKARPKRRSRSRGRLSRSLSRNKRRSLSRSRSPLRRSARGKKAFMRRRRSWSHRISRSPSFSPRRSMSHSIHRSPHKMRKSFTKSPSKSWSQERGLIRRENSLEKLTVVLTTKDKKKNKKKKGGRKNKREDDVRRKKSGNSKEVFASGDNILVSVNFKNNRNAAGSVSPGNEAYKRKKRGIEYEERVSKKKKTTQTAKSNLDTPATQTVPKRVKKITRLTEKDAEVILNRKPVAVIDLDLSPYREQTPSPVNVVVVSDSGSGDEGKEPAKSQSSGSEGQIQSNNEAPSPVTNNYLLASSGPKTPPEPQVKFSISKTQQLRPLLNPLGDDEEEEEEEEVEDEDLRSDLDRRIEKELEEVSHKGPNTPPEPRGPTTPKTPPSPQTSPDAYDPFEPTKSRSPSPDLMDSSKENIFSPTPDKAKEDRRSPKVSELDSAPKAVDIFFNPTVEADKTASEIVSVEENSEPAVGETTVVIAVEPNSNSIPVITTAVQNVPESPDRKISVHITTQNKPYVPVSTTATTLTVSTSSPTKMTTRATTATQAQVTGIQRLQHRLGSPVNRTTPTSVKTPEKRTRTNDISEILSSGNYLIRNASKQNGEPNKPRPLQDTTNETVDMVIDMDDSPYSPASSEGDDLFDPPVEPVKTTANKPPAYKPQSKASLKQNKPPTKMINKFDLLFGTALQIVTPTKGGKGKLKNANKAGMQNKTTKQKKGTAKKGINMKMDEDQLKILDDLPSSAVELQVKDKFLKKLNRQERVIDEVKTVLKPHYAKRHVTKEEYKEILRKAVPKICHSKSGEINPSKIQHLIEAYVKKYRHAKKKGHGNAGGKAKPAKKTMFS